MLTSQSAEALACFNMEPAPTKPGQMDSIEPGEKQHCLLKYTASLERSTIANLILKVHNGSIYHVHVDGVAVRPELTLEPASGHLEFGPTFIYKAGMRVRSLELALINRGRKELNVACVSELPANSPFQFDFKQLILAPGQSVTCPCSFTPREYKV